MYDSQSIELGNNYQSDGKNRSYHPILLKGKESTPYDKELVKLIKGIFRVDIPPNYGKPKGMETILCICEELCGSALGQEVAEGDIWDGPYIAVLFRDYEGKATHLIMRRLTGYDGFIEDWSKDVCLPTGTAEYTACMILPKDYVIPFSLMANPRNQALPIVPWDLLLKRGINGEILFKGK